MVRMAQLRLTAPYFNLNPVILWFFYNAAAPTGLLARPWQREFRVFCSQLQNRTPLSFGIDRLEQVEPQQMPHDSEL